MDIIFHVCFMWFALLALYPFAHTQWDIELNPGPKRRASQTFSICHWNLNSICAHNFAKLSTLRAYVRVHKCNIICLSETYLDSSIDDENLEISGYYLIRSDHPSIKICGGICIYHKNVLPLKVTGVSFKRMQCFWFDNKQQKTL